MPFNPHKYLKENKMTMKNSKNFVRQISESYIQMKLDEERQSLLFESEREWWELLRKHGELPSQRDGNTWSTRNPTGKRPWRGEGGRVRVRKTERPMGPTPSQQAARQELEAFRKGYRPRPTPAQTPQVPRAPTGPTTTTRTPFRLPKIPPAALRLLGRANAVAGAALLGWELGTAIDQYLHPPGPKAPPRPFNQQDVLPSPESLYPSPSNAAGGGGGGGGGGLGGGMGGSGR